MTTYLDHNATTPIRPEVAAAMVDVLRDVIGNPSSTHAAGRQARAAIEGARAAVAAWLGAGADEIVFVSGGTEGDNLAVRGLALAERARRKISGGHVISSPLEHPAVLGALAELEREGFTVTLLPVDSRGGIAPAALQAALRPDTVLVTLAAANHELGNQYDVAALAAIARAGGARFHCDAVAAAGKIAFDASAAGVDAATVSAHKIGGPKGAGALFVRRGVALHPVLAGGHQEHERRPGTENVAAIVGFGVAAALAAAEQDATTARLRRLGDRLESALLTIDGARLHGDREHRVPGTTNVAFRGASGQLVAINLDLADISVSTGAACTSGSLSPSAVLLALGLSPAHAGEAVRISLGRTTTDADVDRLLAQLPPIVARLRGGTDAPTPRITGAGRQRVAVAMSGGVDSSTAAALLVESGVEVVGVTLKLYDASGTSASVGGRCCSPRDIADARATAAALGFPHYVLDETQAFGRAVIDDFVDQHRIGRTPNPCVRCNERLKFGPLLAFAESVGAAALATGHYARLVIGDDGPTAPYLLRAVDRQKDQSYFLFGVRPEIFARVRFPLGAMTKAEVRAVARRAGLANADKPDSQQICFIPDGDHKAFVEARGGAGPAGVIRDEGGARLGAHDGTHRFTVGQRKGVPGVDGNRRFVLRVEPSTGDVVVGPRESLGRQGMHVADVRWLDAAAATIARRRCEVQIRHHAAAAPAWISPVTDAPAAVTVELDVPAIGVAPGQAAVFYDGDRVLGGGWIEDAR
ncbi:MAG TPA: tRNA 2-thiouridine(34) synthase MnmA [Polyangia bacterium]|jgi:cysteine desulfurase